MRQELLTAMAAAAGRDPLINRGYCELLLMIAEAEQEARWYKTVSEQNESAWKELGKVWKLMRRYAQHGDGCMKRIDGDRGCSCGFSEVAGRREMRDE